MTVWIPPHRPVNVDVLHKQGHQQVEEQQELKEEAAVRRQLRDPRVTDRLRGDEGRDGGSRETHRGTAPEERRNRKCTLRQDRR